LRQNRRGVGAFTLRQTRFCWLIHCFNYLIQAPQCDVWICVDHLFLALCFPRLAITRAAHTILRASAAAATRYPLLTLPLVAPGATTPATTDYRRESTAREERTWHPVTLRPLLLPLSALILTSPWTDETVLGVAPSEHSSFLSSFGTACCLTVASFCCFQTLFDSATILQQENIGNVVYRCPAACIVSPASMRSAYGQDAVARTLDAALAPHHTHTTRITSCLFPARTTHHAPTALPRRRLPLPRLPPTCPPPLPVGFQFRGAAFAWRRWTGGTAAGAGGTGGSSAACCWRPLPCGRARSGHVALDKTGSSTTHHRRRQNAFTSDTTTGGMLPRILSAR